jgi:hypothetical protein
MLLLEKAQDDLVTPTLNTDRQLEPFAGPLAVLAASAYVDAPEKDVPLTAGPTGALVLNRRDAHVGDANPSVSRQRVVRDVMSLSHNGYAAGVHKHLSLERRRNARMPEIVALP